MNTFQVSQRALLAAYTHAAVKDVRYYLNGVCIDTRAGRIIATDGHRIFICAGPKCDAGAQYILPASLLDRLKKVKSKHEFILEVSTDGNAVSVCIGPDTLKDDLIDGTFPNYERIIPHTFSGETSQFNLGYLSDAADALALYYGLKKHVQGFAGMVHNGTGPALVHMIEAESGLEPTAFVLVMPMRGNFSLRADLAAFVANSQPAPAAAEQVAA